MKYISFVNEHTSYEVGDQIRFDCVSAAPHVTWLFDSLEKSKTPQEIMYHEKIILIAGKSTTTYGQVNIEKMAF